MARATPSDAPPAKRHDPGVAAEADAEQPGEPTPVFTPEFFDQVNKGPLERAYERRNRDPTTWRAIPWRGVAIGILIGLLFAFVNVYAVLAVGFLVGGSWYVSYFIGLLARWRPGVINYVAGASTGASQVVIGSAYVLPALIFLSDRHAGFSTHYAFDALPSVWTLAGFFMVGGLFGVVFFQFYRHLWVVERPLQYPGGFESAMELLAVADRSQASDRRDARRSIRALSVGAVVAFLVVVLRDLPVMLAQGVRTSILDRLLASRFYSGGVVPDIGVFRPTFGGLFYLSPFILGIGWFVRRRVALVVFLGAVLAHLLPVFDASANGDAFSMFVSWAGARRTLGAGAILGAGLVALVRLRKVIGQGVAGILRGMRPRDANASHNDAAREVGVDPGLPGRIVLQLLSAGALAAIILLALGGLPWMGILALVLVGTGLIVVLGLIGVKVTGETAVQAVSPLTLIALIVLMGLFTLMGFQGQHLFMLGLGGAAFFATGLVMSTDSFLDIKIGHYVGNPARRQATVQMIGLVPGVLLGTFIVYQLSLGIADGNITTLGAPFAGVFAGLAEAVSGGDVWWLGFLIAMGIGAFVELATGLGTAFGIGMVLQFFVPFTLLLGALFRDGVEALARTKSDDPTAPVSLPMAWSVAMPAGLFVGDAVATLVVFALGQFVLT